MGRQLSQISRSNRINLPFLPALPPVQPLHHRTAWLDVIRAFFMLQGQRVVEWKFVIRVHLELTGKDVERNSRITRCGSLWFSPRQSLNEPI